VKNLYLLPILSLLGLAGCSNSPAPDAYVPPAVPAIEVKPTPVPESGGVIDTDKFIAQGSVADTSDELSKRLLAKWGSDSVVYMTSAIIRRVDGAKTTLAAAYIQKVADTIISSTEDTKNEFKANGRFLEDPNNPDLAHYMTQTSLCLGALAGTKYDLLAGNIDNATAATKMANYRSRALAAARNFDRVYTISKSRN